MAKVVDITDKLDFGGNPKLKIREKEYEVNADAGTVLKVMGLFGDGENVTPQAVTGMYNLIFSEKVRKDIDELKLQFRDFQILVFSAINLITGEESVGE